MCFSYPIMNGCSLILIDSQVLPQGNQEFLTSVNTLNIPVQRLDDRGKALSNLMYMLKVCFWLPYGYSIVMVGYIRHSLDTCWNTALNKKLAFSEVIDAELANNSSPTWQFKHKMQSHTHIRARQPFLFLFFLPVRICLVFVKHGATVRAKPFTQRTTWQCSRTRCLSTIAVWMRDLVTGGICLILFNSIPSLSVLVQTPLPRYSIHSQQHTQAKPHMHICRHTYRHTQTHTQHCFLISESTDGQQHCG